ncbi:Zn-dependent hydrolase [Verticiella sediminum]|uniref:Zn-dependent hydrolase n=1 Tax=Verticiella sediminum TaxID=1247510 RepID=A0A556A6E3_9BURK|nr:Zn-dependent hydrolase [Verticiella sediminum]TSH88466.1 Zn-dependent hydrolase [Verticiella sediminum]
MLRIDTARLVQSLMDLGRMGALPGKGVHRLALTDADKAGRDWTLAQMRELGMQVRIDGIGNVVATYAGREDLPAVMTGSHIDTVRTGGLYDGNLGVLAGLEVVRTLSENGVRPRRPIAVAFFTNEEGARFQPDMLGSLVYVGGMPLETALEARDADGARLGDELARIGYAGEHAPAAPRPDSFFELHIEQGPVLHRQGVQIGVVEGVQGICWLRLTFEGKSNHAGTTPMALRRDAGMSAMRTAAFAHELAARLGGRQLATVGSLRLQPDLVNVIAAQASMTVDLRNTDAAMLARARTELLAHAQACAEQHGVAMRVETLADFDPVAFDTALVDGIERHARALGLSTLRLPSGAGHDAQMLARICPSAMIFVPSLDGLSHNVDEYTPAEDIGYGAQILLRAMLERAER